MYLSQIYHLQKITIIVSFDTLDPSHKLKSVFGISQPCMYINHFVISDIRVSGYIQVEVLVDIMTTSRSLAVESVNKLFYQQII